jgi:hypothetical protein
MRRNQVSLGVLALLALACHGAPTATAQQRAAMGPAVEARLAERQVKVKATVSGAQSEHLKIFSPDIGDGTVEMMAFRGIFQDFCAAGFQDVDLSDGLGWRKLWKC